MSAGEKRRKQTRAKTLGGDKGAIKEALSYYKITRDDAEKSVTIPIYPDFLIPYEDRNEYRNDTVIVELSELALRKKESGRLSNN